MGTSAEHEQEQSTDEQSDAAAELFVSSYIKLLRAHGEVYPGASKDADDLQAAFDVETAKAKAASGQTGPVAGDDSLAPESSGN